MNTQIVTTPLVQIPLYGQEARVIPFSELVSESGADPATVGDDELLQLVVNFMDLESIDALKQAIMGEHYSSDRLLKVTRPSTGNVLIAPSAELGNEEEGEYILPHNFTAQRDQILAGIETLATVMTTYYTLLRDGGLSPEEAMQLVNQYHSQLVAMSIDNAKGQPNT
jgi:hypothetical protein